MNLHEMLRGLEAEHEDAEDAPDLRPDPEAAVSTLREVAERYATGRPFRPGDLVTPRRGHNVRDAGYPHVVVEVFDPPIRNLSAAGDMNETSGVNFGRRLDMRIVTITSFNGSVVPFMAESWEYEAWGDDASDG